MTLSLNERDRRYRAFKTLMDENNLSILVVAFNAMWPGHGRYFSEYFPHSGYAYVIFPREGPPTQFVHSKIQEQVAATKWITDSRFGSDYPDVVTNFSNEPDPAFPNVPCSKDVPAFPMTGTFVGPPRLSMDKVKILEAAFAKAVKEPAFEKWASQVGLNIGFMNSEKVREITNQGYKNVQKYFPK